MPIKTDIPDTIIDELNKRNALTLLQESIDNRGLLLENALSKTQKRFLKSHQLIERKSLKTSTGHYAGYYVLTPHASSLLGIKVPEKEENIKLEYLKSILPLSYKECVAKFMEHYDFSVHNARYWCQKLYENHPELQSQIPREKFIRENKYEYLMDIVYFLRKKKEKKSVSEVANIITAKYNIDYKKSYSFVKYYVYKDKDLLDVISP